MLTAGGATNMNKSIKKISFKDPEVSKFQNNVEEVLQSIISCPITNGVLLKNINLLSGQDNAVSHGLNREYVGFMVVRPTANSNVWESSSSNNRKNLTINLRCSVTSVFDIWVF